MVLSSYFPRFRSLVLSGAVLIPLLMALAASPASAANTVGGCNGFSNYLTVDDSPDWDYLPQYGVDCFGVYLEGGHTYYINVNASPDPIDGIELVDSVLTVEAFNKQGVWLDPPLGASNYTFAASNDDISYPDNLSSRVTIAADGLPGSVRLYVIIVRGYSTHSGVYTVDVSERYSLPQPTDCLRYFWLPECRVGL